MDLQSILFHFFGGLGLFLFGIKSMSEGLQAVAGDKLRLILEKGTKTPLRGVLTGLIVTGLIQSSSGTTVLTVGLVNAGLLNLRQAIGIIMGANIGTTVTAYLIGFKLEDYALPIIAAGVLILFFVKNKSLNYFGQVLMGFGMLFYGISIMGDGMAPLKDSEFFVGLMSNVGNNPLLGVLVGTVFTVVVQSSSATIGVLQELAHQGVITYLQAVPILFGDNIGTTITAILAGIGATVAARRAAATHFLFNLIGTCIFLPLTMIGFLPLVVESVTNFLAMLIPGAGTWEALNVKFQIAQTHGLFNITNTLIQLPFVGALAALVTKLIPGDKKAEVNTQAQYLDPRFFTNPSVALGNASREVMHMGKVAGQAVDYAKEYFFKHKKDNRQLALQMESATDRLENQITEYVLKATAAKSLTAEQSHQRYRVLQVIGDMERVGDHSTNIVELTDYALENKIKFSEEAQKDLQEMFAKVQEIYQSALDALQKDDAELATQVLAYDDIIDELEAKLRDGHIRRLNEGTCNGTYGAVFLEIISNLERIGDHAVNIAKYAMSEPKHKLA